VPAKATTIGASVGALRRGISLLAPLSSSAKADDPVRRGHAWGKPIDDTAYWMPRLRGA